MVVLTDELLGEAVPHGVIGTDNERNPFLVINQIYVILNLAVKPLYHVICDLRD